MEYENQPTSAPTNKAAVAAAATVIAFHFVSNMLIPTELLGAYTVIIEYLLSLFIGLLVAWPIRDKAGIPVKKEEADAAEPTDQG